MKTLPRCSCVTRNGTQCGRRVKDGSQPPVCSVHRLQQQGKISGAAQPVEWTPLEIIKKLMRSRDQSIQLRAANAYLDFVEKQPATAPTDRSKDFVKALTPDEKAELHELLRPLDEFKQRIYAREPDLRPDHDTLRPIANTALDESRAPGDNHANLIEHQEPPRPARAVSAAPAEAEPEPVAKALPRELWPAVGLFELKGKVTHSLGDDHANRILDGTIPFEDARDQHQETTRRANAMGRAGR